MKKLAVVLALALTLAGCSGGNSNVDSNVDEENNRRFVEVYRDYFSNVIYVDSKTNVMYYWHKDCYSGGLTVMIDENGQPLLWKGE